MLKFFCEDLMKFYFRTNDLDFIEFIKCVSWSSSIDKSTLSHMANVSFIIKINFIYIGQWNPFHYENSGQYISPFILMG